MFAYGNRAVRGSSPLPGAFLSDLPAYDRRDLLLEGVEEGIEKLDWDGCTRGSLMTAARASYPSSDAPKQRVEVDP